MANRNNGNTKLCFCGSYRGEVSTSSGWWFQPSEKYESQVGSLFPIYGKKNVPNHQPELLSVHRLEEASPTGEAQETAHDDEGLDDETNALDL